MEGRKLQLAGGSTYVVSLPKWWVTRAGLKAGDTVFLDPQSDDSVSIRHRAPDKPAPRKKIFEEKGAEERDHLIRKLVGAYVSGFGLIEIHFTPEGGPFVRQVARDFCRLVVGPEVVEEHRMGLTIQDLSDATDLSAEKCLRRMHLIVRGMLEDSIQSLKTSKETLALEVIQRDQDVDRLYWMVAKQSHTSHGSSGARPEGASPNAVQTQHLVARILERVGDHAQSIATTFPVISEGKGLDPKMGRELEAACLSVVNLLDGAFNALITRNLDAANEVIDECDKYKRLTDSLSHLVATRKGGELLALGTVVNSLGRTAGYASDIAEQAIDLAIMSEPKKVPA